MGEGKVNRIIFTFIVQRNHMVNIDGVLVHYQIDSLLADKTIAMLSVVQFRYQRLTLIGFETPKI